MKKLWSKSWKSSGQSRKQRKYLHNAPLHIRHKMAASTLSKELRAEYNIRAIPVRKGDTVLVTVGDHKEKSGKVTKVSYAKMATYIEGVENNKADGSKTMYPVHPSNLIITKLDTSDKMRVSKIERAKK
ncbi:MAG: 50S ribosomal protein L24 [Candidatus Woesearchaeota archaeon]|jgi:large subunit ribosomal protein L24|nr:50S ribosomal protein L24 [Candidatus Woesearchaeota archaeon]